MLKYGLQARAIEIAGMAMATDLPSSFTEASMIKAVGFDMTKQAAEQAFSQAGLTPNDVQVVELHDCFSANELITYEALGLCPVGGAGKFIDDGDNTCSSFTHRTPHCRIAWALCMRACLVILILSGTHARAAAVIVFVCCSDGGKYVVNPSGGLISKVSALALCSCICGGIAVVLMVYSRYSLRVGSHF